MTHEYDEGIDIVVRRSNILVGLLYVGLFLTISICVFELAELFGLSSSDVVTFERLPLDWAYIGVAVAYIAIYIVTVIAFGMWIHRAASNVVEAGIEGFDYTPGWAVGWYFVPFANLLKPFQAMRQIWNASHGANGDLNNGNGLLTLWWALWIFTNILTNISMRLENDPETLTLSVQIGIVAYALDFGLFPIVIKMVKKTTMAQFQNLRLQALEERFS